MKLIVAKFGGTSVGTIERINSVAKRIKKEVENNNNVIVVVSAMAGETNWLIDLGESLSENPNRRAMDQVVASGEQVSAGLLTIALMDLGYDAISYCGWQVRVITDGNHGKARILNIENNIDMNRIDIQRSMIENKIMIDKVDTDKNDNNKRTLTKFPHGRKKILFKTKN